MVNDYQGLIAEQLDKTFNGDDRYLGNIAESVSYTSVSTGSVYDPTTDSFVNSETVYTFNGKFGKFKKSQMDFTNVAPGDVKLTFPVANLAIEPQIGDYVTKDTVDYEIIEKVKTSAEQKWILQLRRTS